MEESKMVHSINPIFDKNSKVLILGSFPSLLSREESFFYAHPKNRFWKVMAAIFGKEAPITIPEKKEFLYQNHIAIWDVIHSCTIKGSSDASIRDVVPNDLSVILKEAPIQNIFVNGKTAKKYYDLYLYPILQKEAILLPSTSPANAIYSLDKLIQEYKIILK